MLQGQKLKKSKYKIFGAIFFVILIIMVSFFSFTKPKSQLPSERFSFMPQKEQESFLSDIRNYFQDKSAFKLDFSQGVVYGPDDYEYGLDNLAQRYYQAPSNKRGNIVSEHFTQLFKAKEEESELLKDIANFELASNYLSVRLYSPDYAKQVGEDALLTRTDLEDILTVLVLDLPSTIINVKPEQAAKWDRSNDDLFDIALQNTFENNKIQVENIKIQDNVNIWLISSIDLFSTTQALNLHNKTRLIGVYGAIVSIPHRHALMIYPINDKGVANAIQPLILLSNRMYEEGPGSISSNLYWYNEEKFMKLPYSLNAEQKKLNFFPPEDFVKLMNMLVEIQR